MAKKNGGERYDWPALKTEYATSTISLKDLAKKHGIRQTTVTERSAKEGWVKARKEYQARMVEQAIRKAATKDGNKLAKEIAAVEKVSGIVEAMLQDDDQFNKHLVEKRYQIDGTMVQVTEEEVFSKVDTKALRDVTAVIETLEKLKRSMYEIQKAHEMTRQRMEKRRLEIEEERLELAKQQADATKPDKDIHVVIEGYEEGWSE